jgi:hypothetical protein
MNTMGALIKGFSKIKNKKHPIQGHYTKDRCKKKKHTHTHILFRVMLDFGQSVYLSIIQTLNK